MSGFISMGANLAGSLQTAYGYQQAGAAAATSANTNAALADANATAATEQAQQDAVVQQRQSYLAIGAGKAAYGASGVTGDSGSALDVLASSAGMAELERQTIAYKGRMKALGYADQATLDRYGGATAMSQANQKASSVLFEALGSTASKSYDMFGGGNSRNPGISSSEQSTLGSTSPGDI